MISMQMGIHNAGNVLSKSRMLTSKSESITPGYDDSSCTVSRALLSKDGIGTLTCPGCPAAACTTNDSHVKERAQFHACIGWSLGWNKMASIMDNQPCMSLFSCKRFSCEYWILILFHDGPGYGFPC
ncbi:hypothetical protein VNO77_27695 [Canavalia gladiata]|uniref:Uncharacterized protein n=1 Tax=Canavalia gladiata TaxID=3824 RepID=A0AAN9Q4C6_CANGL